MPSLIFTVEDNSPIISYSSGWNAGHSLDDQWLTSYSQSGFSVTDVKGAFVSFTFNGTGVGIYGAKRENHGLYQVKLDNTLYLLRNGSVPGPATKFQEPLFSASGLTQGLHTVTVTNQEARYLDIDFITWETTIGANTDDKLYVDTFQDTSPSFTYLPSEGDWGVSPKNLGSFLGASGHATTKSGASLIYSFNGDGVSLYGPVGPDGPNYVVQVDNGLARNFTTKKEFYMSQALLYHASSLGPGPHNLTLTLRLNLAPQETFAIDYAAVFTTMAPSNTTQMGHNASTGRMISLSTRAIAGLAVSQAALLIISCVMFGLFWCQRRTQGQRARSVSGVDPYLETAVVPTMSPVALPSTYLNYDRGRFRRRALTFINPPSRSRDVLSETPGAVIGTSTSQPLNSTIRPPPVPPRNENPPQYTEDVLY